MAAQQPNNLEFSAEGLYRLGLTEQPFAEHLPQFEDAARITQLNVALSLLQSGERIVIVRGSPGLGKTAFLQRLLELQPPGLNMALTQATPQTTPEALFAHLREASAGEPDAVNSPVERSQVEYSIRGARRAGNRPALIIDDAHQLPERTSTELLSLWGELDERGDGFGLVMAVNSDHEISRSRGQSSLDAHFPAERIHTAHLFPFNEQQTDAYLEHRLTSAGGDPGLLSKEEKLAVFDAAEGHPHLIHKETHRLLRNRLAKRTDDLPSTFDPQATPDSRASSRWPIALGASVVLAGAGATLLLSQSGLFSAPSPELQPNSFGDTNTDTVEPPTGKPLGDTERLFPAEFGQDAPYGLSLPSKYSFGATDLQQDEPQQLTEELAEETKEKADEMAADKEDESTEEMAAPSTEQRDDALPDQPLPVAGIERLIAQNLTNSAANPPTHEQAGPAQEEKPADPAQKEEPADPAQEWINQQDGNHFTVQLIAARDKTAVEDYAREIGLEDDTHVVATMRQGEPWYILLYGSHADRDAASAAIAELPDKIRTHGPWSRPFNSVERAMAD